MVNIAISNHPDGGHPRDVQVHDYVNWIEINNTFGVGVTITETGVGDHNEIKYNHKIIYVDDIEELKEILDANTTNSVLDEEAANTLIVAALDLAGKFN